MSTILKPSIRRMRTIVVLTGRIAGNVMCQNDCRCDAPSTNAASRTSWSRPSRAASSTMNTNGVHCHVSPMMTAIRAAHGSVTQVYWPIPSSREDGFQWALPGVGHHPEHVADADRRDRQRQHEDDAEEPPSGESLDGQERQAEAQQELDHDADEDVDHRDDQRAGPAALAEAASARRATGGRSRRRAPAIRRSAPRGRDASPGQTLRTRARTMTADAQPEDDPTERRRGLQDAQQVRSARCRRTGSGSSGGRRSRPRSAPFANTSSEKASVSDATSGKIDRNRMTTTVGQMNTHRAAPSERQPPSDRIARR